MAVGKPGDARCTTVLDREFSTVTPEDEMKDGRHRIGARHGGPVLRAAGSSGGGATRVVMVDGLTTDGGWNTTGTGTERASAGLTGSPVRLRVRAGIGPGAGRQARFSRSTDGSSYVPLGPAFTPGNARQFLMGHRYAVLDHATRSPGGGVRVTRFESAAP